VKVVILGIDGATLDILGPWAERGGLPNLARVLEGGAHGKLRSTIPPYSAQAWVSMMTGKSPARHGVVDFFEQDANRTFRGYASSTLISGEAIWDTLGRHSRRVGIVNVPLTYPPLPVNGYMVSGFMTPKGRDDYTYPRELREEILGVTGEYDPDPWDPLTPAKDLGSFVHWLDIAERAARYLEEKHPADLNISVIQVLDQLQHLFWDALANQEARTEPQMRKAWPLIQRCYETMDAAIGYRLDRLAEGTILLLVSDHGFQAVNTWFNANRWLADQGFLRFSEGQVGRTKSTLARIGLSRESIKALIRRVDRFGLRRHVGRLTRATISRKLGETLAVPIDWPQTVAYSGTRTSEGIYINLKGREPHGIVEPGDEYEEARTRIMESLSALVDPSTGQPVVSAVYRREDVHSGEHLGLMPDIFFSLDDKPYLVSDSTTTTRVFDPIPKDYVQGRHHSQGLFAAFGTHIAAGGKVENANIVDIAPTVLYAMDLPIPTDMDGRVLKEAFTEEYVQAHPIRYEEPVVGGRKGAPPTVEYTEREQEAMQRRLKGLGYVS